MAERYEQQGNREGALRLYRQIAASEPGHSSVESRIEALAGQRAPAAEPQTRAMAASPAREAAPVRTPATPERTVATRSTPQLLPAPKPGTIAPREMPDARIPSFREGSRTVEDASAPAWATANNSSRDETPTGDSVANEVATYAPLPKWAAEATPETEPAAWATDMTEAETPVAASAESAWSRTSLVRLCPNAGEEVRQILERLDQDDPNTRKQAMIDLASMGVHGAAALPATDVLLHDPDESIQAHAAWAAWSIGSGDEQAISTLASLTQSANHDVVQVSAFFLSSIGAEARFTTTAIREVRNSSYGATRLHLSEALIHIDPRDLESLNELNLALSAEDAELRWLAAVALSGVSPEQASWVVPALAARLNDADASVCSAAALTLGTLGPAAQSAVGSLELAASHQEPDVRIAAEAALACIPR